MRNNEMIKRISVKCMTAIMGAAAVMSPITASMCTVIEAQAEGYTYETWTATSGTVLAGQTVGTNSGTITDNYGTVHNNQGTVTNHSGGKVENNNSGGDVTNNSGGKVEINNSGGIVTNSDGGVVEINNGGDVTNNSGGVLQQNISGTATNNSGGVVQLNNTGGEVTNNDGGTVTNNSGTVFNESDTSVVTNNCSGGIVNGGSVTNNNGTVNEGSVTNNLDGGEVYNGDVTDNWSGGTVNGNSRVTNNHGGTLSGDNIVCQNPDLPSKSGPDPAPVDPTPAPDPTPDPGPSDSSTKNNSSDDLLGWSIGDDAMYWNAIEDLRKRLVPLDDDALGGYQYDNVLSGGPAVAAWNDDMSFKEKIDSGMAALNRESAVTSAGVASGQTLQIDMGNANVFTPVMVNQLAKVTDQGVAVSMTMKENGEQIQLNLVAESDFRAVNFYNEQTGSQAEGPKFLESMIPESSIVYSNGHVNKNTDDIGTNVMKAAGYIGMYQAKQSGVVSAQGAPLEAIVSVSKADAVSSGGTQNIAGGTLTDDNRSSFTEIVSGAITQTIQSGGTATQADLATLGSLTKAGGTQTVMAVEVGSGGTATQTTISGGEQLVSSGGTAKQTTLEGGTQTVIGGVTSGGTQTVDSGRDVKVENGGNIQASSGALQVSNGGTATQITESGGTQTVASGGITISAGLISGGTQTIHNGGTVNAANTATVVVKTQDGSTQTTISVPIPEFSQSLENGQDKAYLVKNGAITQNY